jgi:hypothetical protein
MAKEEKPLEYQRRIRDTKGVAQRLDLDYLKRPSLLLLFRKKATWILVGVAALASVPLVLGLGGSRRTLSTGPLSASHAVFDGRCEVCHAQAFARVPDQACEKCHDGAAHPANLVDTAKANSTPPCAECHAEHRGQVRLGEVSNGNCTRCHANLQANASAVKIKAVEVSAFRERKHPEFSTASLKDTRPFQLNHAKHMPAQPIMFRGFKLPMKCVDCHQTDLNSPIGDLKPTTFERDCKSCHSRELQFDIYGVLGETAPPSPHTRDQNIIRLFIANSYRAALDANPALAQKPLLNDFTAQPNATVWLTKVTEDSYQYLFGKKCPYCHQMESQYEVKKVDPTPKQSPTAPVQFPPGIIGRYAPPQPSADNPQDQPLGLPWFERSQFSHRSHREVECESCHTAARTSMKTEDVLIPVMKSCLPCHGESRAGLDRCSECHQYHNRSLEKERDRRPTEKIIGQLVRPRVDIILRNSPETEPRASASGVPDAQTLLVGNTTPSRSWLGTEPRALASGARIAQTLLVGQVRLPQGGPQ